MCSYTGKLISIEDSMEKTNDAAEVFLISRRIARRRSSKAGSILK